jgi:hypothetical protein
MGPTTLPPLPSKACCVFLSSLKSITSVGFEPANLVSNDQHANNYTTETTYSYKSGLPNLLSSDLHAAYKSTTTETCLQYVSCHPSRSSVIQFFVTVGLFIYFEWGSIPGRGKRIFLLVLGPTQPPVQWVQRVLSPGLKRGRGVTLTTQPHLVSRSRMSRSYTYSPPQSASVACSGTALALFT